MDASEAEALTLSALEVDDFRDEDDEDGSSSLRSDLEFHHEIRSRGRGCRSLIRRSHWKMGVVAMVLIFILIFAAGGRKANSSLPNDDPLEETANGDAKANDISSSSSSSSSSTIEDKVEQLQRQHDLDQKNADLDREKKTSVAAEDTSKSTSSSGDSSSEPEVDENTLRVKDENKEPDNDGEEERRFDDIGGPLDDDLPFEIIKDYPNPFDPYDDDNINDNDEDINDDDGQENAQGTWYEDDNKKPKDQKSHDDKTPAPTTRPSPQPSINSTISGEVPVQENEASSSTSTSNETSSTEEADHALPVQPTHNFATRPPSITYQYRRRGNPSLDQARKEALAKNRGQWTLVDPKADQRPSEDYCAGYPSRDIPWDEFPETAWQKDPDYRAQFLGEGKLLVERAMEAHLAEYGFGKDGRPGQDFETRINKSPFRLDFFEIEDEEERRKLGNSNPNDRGGRTTQKSYDGLVRRLLHAVVTGDSFNLVLGGHSAAAGHGNHFQQSYTLQFQRIMEPVLARLGVKHYSRNTGMGGLGTIQNAMGAQHIYGLDADILVWDSGMTENGGDPAFDLFARAGILGSDRAPMLWSGSDDRNVYPALQKHADVDYMIYGTGKGAIPSTDPSRLNEIPWAARYLKCDNDYKSLCADNRYNGTCWIERPDHFQPPTPQKAEPGGRASWHGGNREHQLTGRILSFTVLRALYSALDLWDKQPGHNLDDSMWHMSDYYDNIKSKVANLDPSVGTCYEIEGRLTPAFCRIPFQSRSEITPRANPDETSLRSIMKPFGPDFSLPQPKQNIYDPPDVYNPVLGVPDGEVDYLAIVENGVDYLPFKAPASPLPATNSSNQLIKVKVDADGKMIRPGLGWGVQTRTSPHLCNGTYDSFCGRGPGNECLLYGHNDFRGGLSFDSLSGWGIFTLRNLRNGMIFVKMDSWRSAEQNPVTEGWTEVNNGTDGRSLSDSSQQEPDENHWDNGFRRRLKKDDNQKFCPDFMLEFAVGGEKIVQIPSDEILGKKHSLVERVVQIWTVLDDPDFTNGKTVDVELGIRIRGCGRQHVFWVTHLYWS